MIAGPRGAVGGCSTPSSRVDPWWHSSSIDEGPLLNDNDDYQFCSLQSNHNRLNSQANQYHHQERQHQQEQQQQQQQCSRGGSNNGCYNGSNTSSAASLGYVESTRPNVTDGSDPYGLISRSLQQSSAGLLQQQLAAGSSDHGANLARVGSSQNQQQQQQQQQRQLTSLLATSSPASSSTPIAASPDSLNGLLSYNTRVKGEETSNEDRATSSTNYNTSLLSTLLSTPRISPVSNKSYGRRDNNDTGNGTGADAGGNENSDTSNLLLVKLEYSDGSSSDPREEHNKVDYSLGGSPSGLLLKQRATPTDITAIDMKFETQSGPPTTPSHLTTGVEPPHSSQGNQGIVVGGSPGEVVGVDSMLLSPWGAAGTEFLEAHDVKQANAGLDEPWDSIMLGASINPAQSLAELKPLPPFTGYTGHLSINGIPGHHYHTIASSAQRPSMQSTSPSPSSNHEYYESSVVSSSTPCPQSSQKQQHHHHHQQQQQELPQSSHPGVPDYINNINNIDDLAEIIGSAMADTTVPGSGNNGPGNNSGNNGPSSEHDAEVSPRDWIDIAEWIDTACSPKTQETNSSSPYPQIYATAATTTPSNPPPQQHGSTLQNLLTHSYSPMLQQRLQASCGETPSSTSPYPPVSPPGRVSTSCSPDHQLHSSFATPQHTRKRSRPSGGGSHNPSKKNPNTTTTTTLPYGTESGLIGGKEKPVHRCSICNRGFLNKSNIKVHLRTHTGEKPFRCEVCGKAFRQKAHLIKHQQIHKRIGRD